MLLMMASYGRWRCSLSQRFHDRDDTGYVTRVSFAVGRSGAAATTASAPHSRGAACDSSSPDSTDRPDAWFDLMTLTDDRPRPRTTIFCATPASATRQVAPAPELLIEEARRRQRRRRLLTCSALAVCCGVVLLAFALRSGNGTALPSVASLRARLTATVTRRQGWVLLLSAHWLSQSAGVGQQTWLDLSTGAAYRRTLDNGQTLADAKIAFTKKPGARFLRYDQSLVNFSTDSWSHTSWATRWTHRRSMLFCGCDALGGSDGRYRESTIVAQPTIDGQATLEILLTGFGGAAARAGSRCGSAPRRRSLCASSSSTPPPACNETSAGSRANPRT